MARPGEKPSFGQRFPSGDAQKPIPKQIYAFTRLCREGRDWDRSGYESGNFADEVDLVPYNKAGH
jgi:hypothetical protein